MNRIQQLIKQLCPNGVEWKKLGDKTVFNFHYGKGNTIPNNGGKIPVYGCNGIVSYTDNSNCENVAVIGHIGSAGAVNWASGECYVTYNGTIADIVDESKVISRYLYEFLQSINLPKYVKGSQPFLSVSDFSEVEIPVPPLPIQEEIVRILDKFVEQQEQLEKLIELRKKQYEYYREELLRPKEGWVWKTLGEVFTFRNGYTPSTTNKSFWNGGTISWFKMEDLRNNGKILKDSNLHITPIAVKGDKLFKANSILIATSATIGEHALILVEHLSNQRFTNIYPKDIYENKIDMHYINHYMPIIDEWCKKNVKLGNFASVDMDKLKSLSLPVPPLPIQEEIVSKLDKFVEQQEQLEKLIEQSKKQYEYYREELLRF